ncbi:MAG: HAD hydrolase-like protein [bacterium]|nr:HAD hydrolase-like protein [bacterium]
MKHLILFDVDGTLLRCGRQVGAMFVDALTEVFGDCSAFTDQDRLKGYSFAGKTDPRIVVDLIRATGRRDEEILPHLAAVEKIYVENLERGLDPGRVRLLPGVRELLERLSAREDVLVGLLTGNWRRGARIKLSCFDLERYFAFGAFGDDAIDRCDLGPVALQRAAVLSGRPFALDRSLIVGDTVLDVECARSAGIRSMAVATGFTEAEPLEAAGADWVFADLERAAGQIERFTAPSPVVTPAAHGD